MPGTREAAHVAAALALAIVLRVSLLIELIRWVRRVEVVDRQVYSAVLVRYALLDEIGHRRLE